MTDLDEKVCRLGLVTGLMANCECFLQSVSSAAQMIPSEI